MSAPDPSEIEDDGEPVDQFTSIVNWYDDRLRAGDDPETGTITEGGWGHSVSTDSAQPLDDMLSCLRQLRGVWGTLGIGTSDEQDQGPVEGDLWLDRFRIGPEIGRGAFGTVRRAYDQICQREVALKFPRIVARRGIDRRHDLLAEAKTAALFAHPGILPVYDLGFSAAGLPYFVMPHCDGGSLHDWLQAHRGPVSPQLCAEIVRQLADAVQYSHDRKIVHRDLKPGNILLQSTRSSPTTHSAAATPPFRFLAEWRLQVADFGLALWQSPEAGGESTAHPRAGTLRYMAPEQRSGSLSQVGPATDVYALGVILQELLTGQPESRHNPASAPVSLPGDTACPRDLRRILQHCLAPDAADRYASAWQLRDDLRRFLTGSPISGIHGPRKIDQGFKWLGRNRSIVALTCCLLGLLVWMAVMLWPDRRVIDLPFPGRTVDGGVQLNPATGLLTLSGSKTRLAQLETLPPGGDLDFEVDLRIPQNPIMAGVFFGYHEIRTEGVEQGRFQVLGFARQGNRANRQPVLRRWLGMVDARTGEVTYSGWGQTSTWTVPQRADGTFDMGETVRLKVSFRNGEVAEVWFDTHRIDQFTRPDVNAEVAGYEYPTAGPLGVFLGTGGVVWFDLPQRRFSGTIRQ